MADDRTLREVGEHPFLRKLCARLRARDHTGAAVAHPLLVPPGDDCAVLPATSAPLAVTTDALVEGVHFRDGWLTPAEIGRRAVVVNLSDLAAMGASPAYTLAAVTAPPDLPAHVLDEILDGCAAASEEAGAVLAGGNLTRSAELTITVTALGTVDGPCLTRASARPGDLLVVTGTLGGAAAAVAELRAGRPPAPALRARYAAPVARVAAGRVLAAAGAHAAIDVSDGFLADLRHLCEASEVGAVVDEERVPRLAEVAELDAAGRGFALSGGEDYELLAACPPELANRLPELAREAGVEMTVVGRCTDAAEGIVLRGAHGAEPGARGGFDHFMEEP